jgi:protein-arginine kinase
MTDLDEVVDRLREIAGQLREASEDSRWYIVEEVIKELEDVINDLWGLSIRCRCNSRELGSPETPPRKPTVLGNTVRGGGG